MPPETLAPVWLQEHSELIGSLAGVLTTVAFFPQLYKTWRRGGEQLSWGMLMLFGIGVALWLVYGLLRKSVPIIAANGATEIQIALLVGLKVWRMGSITPEELLAMVNSRQPAGKR